MILTRSASRRATPRAMTTFWKRSWRRLLSESGESHVLAASSGHTPSCVWLVPLALRTTRTSASFAGAREGVTEETHDGVVAGVRVVRVSALEDHLVRRVPPPPDDGAARRLG